jgi:tetratricopeptide (TPR) repeat protein
MAVVEQYLAKYPDDPNLHTIHGMLLAETNEYEPAKAEFERAIQLNPKHFVAYVRLARLEQDRNDIDGAIRAYEKALSLQPRQLALVALVGNLYLEDKVDLATARKYYEQALTIDPQFAPAVANLAYVEAKQGDDLNVALGLAQKAKQLAPDAYAITDILAWVEYLKGSYEQTVPMFKDCVRKDPQRGVYRYHLGMALLATGNKEQAKSELDAALHLKLSPDDAQHARDTLTQIQSN